MPETDGLKNVVEDVISSYEARIQGISTFLDTNYLLVNDFQEDTLDAKKERGEINTQIRDILARNEHLRRKDFDNMMQGILSAQEKREKEVKNFLKSYLNEQKDNAQILRDNLGKFRDHLSRGEVKRVKEFHGMIKDILAKQDQRKEEVISKLKEFQKEQQDITGRLKELLGRGRELRIQDLKAMLKEFRDQGDERLASRRKRREQVVKMLERFKKERQQIRPSPKGDSIYTGMAKRKKLEGGD